LSAVPDGRRGRPGFIATQEQIIKAAFLLAAAFLAAAPAIAQPPAAVPEAVPVALVDELMSILPHQEEWAVSGDPDAAEMAAIAALNPGREKEVQEILADHARCLAPAVAGATRRAIRTLATNLGADKLRRLIAFYRSDDFRRLEAIDALAQKAKRATPAQQEEMVRIIGANPVVAEFGTALQRSGELIAQDQAFTGAAGQCEQAREASFAKARLKSL
jgi:hypothetical protein